MAGNKYLKIGTLGLPTEQEATQSSAGAGDAGKITALDSTGHLDPTMMPPGVGQNLDNIEASENLAAGDFVDIFDNSGTIMVRKADASNGRRAHGFVRASVLVGATASVYGPGELNDQLSGLTIGIEYFLSTSVAGSVQSTVPSAAGHLVQALGVSKSTTALRFNPTTPLLRA